jgi:hypothetical protein
MRPPIPLAADAIYGVGTTEYMRSQGGYAITLECGQHEDPASPEVAYRAIRNTLAFLGHTGEPAPAPVEQYEALRLHEVIDRDHAEDQFSPNLGELRSAGAGRRHRQAPRGRRGARAAPGPHPLPRHRGAAGARVVLPGRNDQGYLKNR